MLEERAVLAASALELAVVLAPTATSAQGEVAVVPRDVVAIDEWRPFFVEVWASTPMGDAQDIDSADFDLAFDLNQLDLLSVNASPGFMLNASATLPATIDAANSSGTISIDGTALQAGLGDQGAVLVATLSFRADGVSISEALRLIGPQDMGLSLTSANVELTPGSPEAAFRPADPITEIWAIPYDLTNNDRVGFTDLALFTAHFLLPVTDAEPAQVWQSDFDQNGFVGFGDFSLFVANFLHTKPDAGISFATTFPDAWRPDPLVDLNGSAELGIDFFASYTAGDAPVLIGDLDLEVRDHNSAELTQVVVTIVNRPDTTNERLTADTTGTSITAAFDQGTGVLTLSGADTLGHYQQVLRTVAYSNVAAQVTLADRVLRVAANDGTAPGDVAIAIIAVAPASAENLPPNLAPVGPRAGLVDVPLSITVTATDPNAGDTLTFMLDEDDSPPGATIQQIDNNTAIVRYTPRASDLPGPLSFRVIVLDSGDPTLADVETFQVSISNPVPIVDLNGDDGAGLDHSATFQEGGVSVSIVDSDLTVRDENHARMASANVSITNLLDAGAETLNVDVLDTAITAMYNSATGVLSLSGLDSTANYARVLRTLTYDNSRVNPDRTDRIVRVIVNDGVTDSAPATSTVHIANINDPPNLVPIPPANLVFGGVAVEFTVTATDPDGDELFFMLDEDNSPAGATIEQVGNTAIIRWTAAPGDLTGTHLFRVIVLDSGDPVLADVEDYFVSFAP